MNWLKNLFSKHTVETIVSDFTKIVDKLDRLADRLSSEIEEHLTTIEVHQGHVEDKTNEANRAQRIRAKVQEILQ